MSESWLSEIEKEVKEFRESTQDLDPEYLSIQGAVLASTVEETERMARVIRELARLVLMFHALSPVPQINLQKAVDISPDVKEVLRK